MKAKTKPAPKRKPAPSMLPKPPANGNGRKLSAYQVQSNNANRHKALGMKHLADGIREYGIADGITVAADGESISGSARIETLATLMPDVKIVEVETDGNTLLVNRRMDIPNTADPRAQLLSAAVNIVARNNYDPDGALLAALANSADDDILKRMIAADEMSMRAVMDAATDEPGDAEPQTDRADELRVKWGTERGQLWRIGSHRLLCGDSTVREDVERVMGGEKADMIFTDPPYGVDYEYSDHKDDPHQYENLANGFWDAKPSAPLCMLTVGHKWNNFWFAKNPQGFLVWFDKTKQSPSNIAHLCKSELILIFGKVFERFAWDTLEIQQPRNDGLRELHTCPKPIELWKNILEVQKGAIVVYDPFGGSGTTMVACNNLMRKCRMIEISPAYCAVILQRFQDAFGIVGERIP